MTIEESIRAALIEDIGNGDHSSLACISENIFGEMQLLVKEEGVIAGIDIAKAIFQYMDSSVKIECFKKDGDEVQIGEIVFIVAGNSRAMLTAERTVLNFMQRMSGIATSTRHYVKELKGTTTKILDTRKTTPNSRIFEKYAVKIGGAENHRFGLYDMIMLKDNHIDFAGGIEQAIDKTIQYLQDNRMNLLIEIETRNLEEVKQVVDYGGIDRIMLDNFTPAQVRKALEIIKGDFETEASGKITLDNIREYAETGVNFISVGALTHHIKSLDLSLKVIH